jgi:hypothetical protein
MAAAGFVHRRGRRGSSAVASLGRTAGVGNGSDDGPGFSDDGSVCYDHWLSHDRVPTAFLMYALCQFNVFNRVTALQEMVISYLVPKPRHPFWLV